MKKNKIILIVAILLVLIIIGILLFVNGSKKIEKFYLDDEYYNELGLVTVEKDDFEKLLSEKKNFLLFIYNDVCSFKIPCDTIYDKVAKDNKFEMLQMNFREFKDTSLYGKVKYAPSVIVIKDGKIVDFLDAESDEDLDRYQDGDKFLEWLSGYIYLNKE